MPQFERLPKEVVEFITDADTVFIGSVYKSDPATAAKFPSHTGMNARGGLPGFMRVSPSDGRSVVLPDYSGNRFMSSLGNVESSKQLALTIVSFTTGDVLYLTGTADNLVGPAALEVMVKHASITVMKTTGFIFIRDALPVRQQFGTEVERSPYSPKVKYLVDEPEGQASAVGMHKARLASATQLSHDLAVFRFKVTSNPGVEPIKIRPGQAVALDFMDWIGPPAYQHMANSAPGSVNDDRVRTWTVSSTHEGRDVTWFDLTMREMKGGAVTGALFDVLRRHPSNQWEKPITITEDIVAEVVGVTGDFFLGQGNVNMLWVAGGIGITPFLAMFNALSERRAKANGDVVLALSTREPEMMLRLVQSSLRNVLLKVRLRIDIFTSQEYVDMEGIDQKNVQILIHKGRIRSDYWPEVASGRDVLICGPGGFGDLAMDGLRAAGVSEDKILREGFY
jgi:NAD(P)H-flavin reductase